MIAQTLEHVRTKFPLAWPEDDGSITVPECPVCRDDNYTQKRVKIYVSDAGKLTGVSCARFIGAGAEDNRKHCAPIYEMLGLEVKRAPFISETLLGGTLTLECEPIERGKALIVARNCTSDLHRDVISLDRGDHRSKFVKMLESFDGEQQKEVHRALLRLADRLDKVKDAVNEDCDTQEESTSFIALPDGRVAEQIVYNGKAQFAVYDPASRSTAIVNTVKDGERTYRPLQDELLLRGGLRLPSGVEEYGDEQSLREEIAAYLNRHIDLIPLHRLLLALYVMFSWVYDRFSELSYIRLLGEPGNGKSRAGYVAALICRRPLLLVDPSPSVIYRVIEKTNPTLFLDEFNPKNTGDDVNELMPILNCGFMKDFMIGRTEKGPDGQFETKLFSPYGCKIIASYKPLDSAAFESRGHQLLMQKTKRTDICLSITEQMRREALSLTNKLLLYRLRNYHRDWESGLWAAHAELRKCGLPPRAIQISGGLYSMMISKTEKASFVNMLQDRDERDREERQQSRDGQLVEAIYYCVFIRQENGAITLRPTVDAKEIVEGEPCKHLATGSITDRLNEGKDDKEKVKKESVGKAISKLSLKKKPITERGEHRNMRAIVWDTNRLTHLFESYGLALPEDFSPPPLKNPTPPDADDIKDTGEKTYMASGGGVSSHFELTPDGEIEAVASDGGKVASEGGHRVTPSTDASFYQRDQQVNDMASDGVSFLPLLNGDYFQDIELTPNDMTHSVVALDVIAVRTDQKRGLTARNAKLIGMSLSYDGSTADYVTDRKGWPLMMPEPEYTVIFHDAKFNLGALGQAGQLVPENWEDTMIAAHLVRESGKHDLQTLAKSRLNVEEPLCFEKNDKVPLPDPEIFNERVKNNARFTHQLWPELKREMELQGLMPVYDLEKRVVPVVLAMERAGMKLDVPMLTSLAILVNAEIERIKAEAYDYAGCSFDLNSSAKVAVILFNKLGLPSGKLTSKGQRSVDKEVLEDVRGFHPAVDAVLRYRELDKLANTLIKTLPEYADEVGRVHPQFKQLGAKTGRFSCSEPNVQQIPARSEFGKKLRAAFIAETGHKLVVADWSQMELRVLAQYSKDPLLVEAYTSEIEIDLHTMTASRMFGKPLDAVEKQERTVAKMINFGIAYGITPRGLFNRLRPQGVEVTETECERFVDDYFKTYPGVRDFLDKAERAIRERGYVKSLFGRRRRVAGDTRREVRQAQNFVIQGTAADLAKDALVRLHAALPDGARLIAQIHDEFIVECRMEQAEAVRDVMIGTMSQTPKGFTIPLRVDIHIGDNWGECK